MSVTCSCYPTPDGSMELYEAFPDGEPKGAVIVIQEAFGVNDHIQDVTRRFAAAGYVGGRARDVPPRRWRHRARTTTSAR